MGDDVGIVLPLQTVPLFVLLWVRYRPQVTHPHTHTRHACLETYLLTQNPRHMLTTHDLLDVFNFERTHCLLTILVLLCCVSRLLVSLAILDMSHSLYVCYVPG